ncbi:universal stress protein [Roseobacter sp. HKCCD9010]|uniref:universal stress protein n=1 Tax=unclassified Roseobacter TaxID=196798 RepID=UPI001490F65B|nr:MULTISPECIES: universal stress protein [unclassified Roseobacter]MBF9048539.1 universal stress protein [Rhodobacterales bacterium HKCCD4356]NNV10538.1 universal stress protein [Roseobacter sp. HKCCD7357]NNV14723.1 universal stress protein [Roseobacter sp. HKCCD8768]NNV24182.1 universal stress protein [Roseobacter sp. HKCCD8192]NNV28439.1 universal stress protein [Roseobacter sp. HKCCD9061]
MGKIIALVDGSTYSESVCDHAAWVAKGKGWSVDILHVIGRRDESTDPRNLSGNIGLGARTALLHELAELDAQRAKLAQKRGRAILEDAVARVSADGVEAHSKLRMGDLVETLREMETEADLVIVGKRGEAADFATMHLGSNLERAVRSSTKPVLVASRAFQPVKKLLVAFDGGTSALKAVDHIARSELFAGLDIHLLTVGSESTAAKRGIEGAAALLKGAGYEVTCEIVAGEPDKVIADRAEAHDFDLLIMGAYGHSRIRSLFIGSTTTEMIRSCKVPVLLFR